MKRPHFAICPRGLEPLLVRELEGCGATRVRPEAGGVAFLADARAAYAANLQSRIASRVLMELARAPYRSEDEVYEAALALPWEEHFGASHTLRVDVSARRSPLRSPEFVTLRIKDAIVDRIRSREGERPSVDRARPDARVYAYLDETSCTFYLDLSGEALFKRGWRADKGEAPLKENLAAGLLMLAGWTPERVLLDPFCGSGTLAIEAAAMAARQAPGLARRFGFERLRSFDPTLWNELKDEARAAVRLDAPAAIHGADISTRVVEQARTNARLAGLDTWLADGRLQLAPGDARSVPAPAPVGLIVTNPPYGEQSSPRSATVPSMMKAVADHLKREFAGWEAWLLTSDRALPRQMRLSETRKVVLFNGPLECRLFRFELVAGSYRKAPAEG